MCGICGCADPTNQVTMTDMASGKTSLLRTGPATEVPVGLSVAEAHAFAHAHGLPHDHDHGHAHAHAHDHGHDHGNQSQAEATALHGGSVALETAILAKNDAIAQRNRGWFEGRGVLALNFVSSPGAGKTALLEATIRALAGQVTITVIEGDQMTSNDAERIRAAGAAAIQINTGAGCHLEADMVAEAARALNPPPGSLLLIENVGNLVCPAMFDLGEAMKIAVISTTEGEDKPLKYPHMFRAVKIVIVNKMDLAPHVGFDEAACCNNIRAVNPVAEIICVSAKTGQNLDAWLTRLLHLRTDLKFSSNYINRLA